VTSDRKNDAAASSLINSPIRIERTFLVLRLIGEAGMAEVFDALETEINQTIAVKTIRADLLSNDSARERFVREAEIMASVNHPGVLPVYGIGKTTDGRNFYAMKKVQGETLEELLLKRSERISDLSWINRLLDIFEKVCDTIAYAHAMGIIHRDLKPANIMLDEQGGVYVLDWGIAKRFTGSAASFGGMTMKGDILGSPGYMSPEQASGGSAEAAPPADVFALGVILYEILTGTLPFEGSTQREMILSTIYRNPTDPRRLNPWISKSLSGICRKSLAKETHDRYASAVGLRSDMRSYRAGSKVTATRPSLSEVLHNLRQRYPTRAAVTLGLLLTCLLLSGFFAVRLWQDGRLVEVAWQTIGRLDTEISSLESDIRRMESEVQTVSSEDRDALLQVKKEMQATHLLLQYEALTILHSIQRQRLRRAPKEIAGLAHARLFATVRFALDSGAPETAFALTSRVLRRSEEGTSIFPFSPSEIERLQGLSEEASLAAPGLRLNAQ